MRKRILGIAILACLLFILVSASSVFANQIGVYSEGGNLYYAESFDSEGKPVKATDKIVFDETEGKYYDADSDGKLTPCNGVITYEEKMLFVTEGVPNAIGLAKDATGTTYYVKDDTGAILVGPQVFTANTGKLYYVAADGKVKTNTGWVTVNNTKYYAKQGGVLARNEFVDIVYSSGKKHTHYFLNDGSLPMDRIITVNGFRYAASPKYGIIHRNGRIIIGNHQYWARPNGILVTGATVKEKTGVYRYFIGKYGFMATNCVVKYNGNYFWIRSNGLFQLTGGWHSQNGYRYFGLSNGVLARNRFIRNGNYYYYFDKYARMVTKPVTVNGVKVTPASNGAITVAKYNQYQTDLKIKKARGTYILVDISEQTLRLYKNGNCVMTSPVTTGNVSHGSVTPTGTYSIRAKMRNQVLRGYNYDGTKYTSPVQYWLPFIGNAYGLHDASWRSAFGGKYYLYDGSHGCINMPLAKVAYLYNNISPGMVIKIVP